MFYNITVKIDHNVYLIVCSSSYDNDHGMQETYFHGVYKKHIFQSTHLTSDNCL